MIRQLFYRAPAIGALAMLLACGSPEASAPVEDVRPTRANSPAEGDDRGLRILSSRVELIRFGGTGSPFGVEFLSDNNFSELNLAGDEPHWEGVEAGEKVKAAMGDGRGLRFEPSPEKIVLSQEAAAFYEPVKKAAVAVVKASGEAAADGQLAIVLDIFLRNELENSAGAFLRKGTDEFLMEVPLPPTLERRHFRLRIERGPSDEPAALNNVSLVMRPATPEEQPTYHVVNGDFESFHYEPPPYPWTALGPSLKPGDLTLADAEGNHYMAIKPSGRVAGVRQEVYFNEPAPKDSKIIIGAIARGADSRKLKLQFKIHYKDGSTRDFSTWFLGSEDWTSLRTAGGVPGNSPAVSATVDLVCEEGVSTPMHVDDLRVVVLAAGDLVALDPQGRLLPRAIE